MLNRLLSYFTDPILAPPMWATIMMCLSTSVVGVLLIVRKRALLGEAISHTTYLGIALLIYLFADVLTDHAWLFPILVMVGAVAAAFIGLKTILFLEKKQKVAADSALCFVLSTFLGLGVLVGSRLQFSHPVWGQKIHMFLYGQAATIVTSHVWIYACLTTVIVSCVMLFYPLITLAYFDREYAITCGVKTKWIAFMVRCLIIFAIVIGIRSVGVLMMSGMLIAPAAAAKMVSQKFSHVFVVAAILGSVSGILGNVLSVELSQVLSGALSGFRVSFPTGPMILIVSVMISLFFMLFSRRGGFVWRKLRQMKFVRECCRENILKALFKKNAVCSYRVLHNDIGVSHVQLFYALFLLWKRDMVGIKEGRINITSKGVLLAKKIVRLHRLWEVYLFKVIGVSSSDVHRSAEEMEHILTPEIERALTEMLGDPKKDPHDQEIPLAGKTLGEVL